MLKKSKNKNAKCLNYNSEKSNLITVFRLVVFVVVVQQILFQIVIYKHKTDINELFFNTHNFLSLTNRIEIFFSFLNFELDFFLLANYSNQNKTKKKKRN